MLETLAIHRQKGEKSASSIFYHLQKQTEAWFTVKSGVMKLLEDDGIILGCWNESCFRYHKSRGNESKTRQTGLLQTKNKKLLNIKGNSWQ